MRPSRLIDLGTFEEDCPRLCLQADFPADLQYATLSHCWGVIQGRVHLTQRCLEAWQTVIPKEALMSTFKDAIKVTRSLGMRYLWIDSLCIIQDSKNDWHYESSRMSNVYKYAHCNIAATASEGDASGMFTNRDPPIDLPVLLDFANITCDFTESESRTCLKGVYSLHRNYMWFYEVGVDAPLTTRAWVVQERLLAPRTLHFANTQIYWECNELQACESWPKGMPQELFTNVKLKANNPFNLQREFRGKEVGIIASNMSYRLHRSFHAWGEIVLTYSRGRLTYGEDKLVAISALAREMKPLMQCRYLAGHWEIDLIRQLGWPGYHVSERAPRYRAPSWAWTSTNGEHQSFSNMYLSDERFCPLAEILHSHVNLASEDEFGPVEGGHLEIRGKLLSATPDLYNHQEQEIDAISKGNHSFGKPLRILGKTTHLRFNQDGNEPEPETPLYCMPLSLAIPDGNDDYIWFNGLMLQPTGTPDVYRRAGSIERLRSETFGEHDPIFPWLGQIERRPVGG
ncbi:MAG: hypothetical protein Q9205_003679, partial [Flavoplaca limonia]